MNQEKLQLLSTIRDIYGRVVWSHKVHEKQRELCSERARRDNWTNVILTASTTVIAVVSMVLDDPWADVVTLISAGITTLYAVYRLSFSPESESQSHRQAAKSLLIERDNLLLLVERCMAAKDEQLDEIRRELKKAIDKVGLIYSSAPNTSSEAFTLASKALHMNQEFTFSSKEVDLLLPPQLRLENKDSKLD